MAEQPIYPGILGDPPDGEPYRTLVELSPDAVFVLFDDRIVFANRALLTMVAATDASQVLGRSPIDFVHPASRELAESRLARLRLRGEPNPPAVERLLRLDGSTIDVEVRSAPVPWAGGNGVQVIARDLTEGRRTRAALEASEARFRALFEHSLDGVTLIDGGGITLYASPSTERILGYRPDELVGRSGLEYFHPDDLPVCADYFRELLASPGAIQSARYRYRAKDGSWRWIDGVGTNLLDDPLVAAIVINYRDVTEQKRAADALRHSEEQLRLITDNMLDLVSRVDLDGTYRYVSPAFRQVLGHEPEALVGTSAFDLVHPDDLGPVRTLVERAIAQRHSERFEFRYRHADGRYLWLEAAGKLLVDDAGVPAGAVVSSRDITERRRFEVALARSEARLRNLFEGVIEGAFQATPDGRIAVANPALVALLGYESADALRQVDVARDLFVRAGDAEAYRRELDEAGEVRNFELRLRRRDGQVITVLENARAVRDGTGRVTHYEGTITDITERKRLQEQLQQSQKMEAMGRLAGGVAHDFNNLLTAILGFTEMLLETVPAPDPRHVQLRQIEKAAGSAAALTRQLLAFSRRQVLQLQILDLNAVIADIGSLLERVIGEDVHLVLRAAPYPATVIADRGQVEQVIINLCVNSRDAMPGGGTLTIETAAVDVRSGEGPAGLPAGRYMMLTIGDTGVGMDPEVRRHLFEPFFTTKSEGKGTGLGLATVYGIVQQTGGAIDVESEPGRGATFRIWLPAAGGSAGTSDPPRDAPVAAAGRETILLVEDQDDVRRIARSVLVRHGYTVMEAANGAEAIQVALATRGPIHLLLTDVVMPVMGGGEVGRLLRAIQPDLRILYMSGYPDDAVVEQGLQAGGVAFLQKPFTPDGLLAQVRQTLDAPR